MTTTGTDPLFIGIDIGTSSVKALLAAPGGAVLDSFGASHGMTRATPGAAEQDPSVWQTHVEAALARFAAHPRAGAVAAIGITSQVNTHVFCDERLAPLRPAITWQDTRPAPQAARLDAQLDEAAKIAALGAPIPIDASHALSRMAHVAETEPDIWAKTRHVLLPKDYITARLTGEVAADPISAVGLVGVDLAYAGAILDLLPRAAEVLPPLSDPCTVAGTMAPGQPFAGVPVAVGTMDAWASMFGVGVASEGQAMYLSGTSEVLGLISSTRNAVPGVITFPNWNGITLHAGPTQSGGASLNWLSGLVGQEIAVLDALADSAPLRPESPLFLPHLEGERAPLWDPQSRGAFVGMSSSTGPAELCASVMEGVAFAARLAFEAVEASGGMSVDALRLGGGGAISDSWNRIRASALGRRLDRVSARETGAMGALAIAAVASGTLSDLRAATEALVAIEQTFEPEERAATQATERFAMFKELYQALKPLNHRLTGSQARSG